MAKLENVRTIDMVNGEITKVEYNGAVYEKHSRGLGNAKTGDLFLSEGGGYTTIGSFYEIKVDESSGFSVRYVDDEGDYTGYSPVCEIHTLFIKVSDSAITFKGDQYTRVDRKAQPGDVVEYRDGFITEVYGFCEGGNLRAYDRSGTRGWKVYGGMRPVKVYAPVTTVKPQTAKRKARVGERILITDASAVQLGTSYKNGDILTVTSIGILGFPICGAYSSIKDYEYEVIIENNGESTSKFKEGDRVKALADGEFGDVNEGEIGTIASINDDDDPYNIYVETSVDNDYFRPQDLELVAEDKSARPSVGDVVKVALKESYHNANVGDIVKIVKDEKDRQPYFCEFLDGRYAGWFFKCEVELIENKPYNPSVGDIVVVTANTNRSLNKVGDIGKITKIGRTDKAIVVTPKGTDHCVWTLFSEMRPATDGEKAKYEKSLAKSELIVGDYVKVISNRYNTNAKLGEIVEITEIDCSGVPYAISSLTGKSLGWVPEEHVETVSESESKWAKIGRKPDEFKKGDIVRGCRYDDTSIRCIGEVEDISFDMLGVRDGGKSYHATYKKESELIAPVESRVDVE